VRPEPIIRMSVLVGRVGLLRSVERGLGVLSQYGFVKVGLGNVWSMGSEGVEWEDMVEYVAAACILNVAVVELDYDCDGGKGNHFIVPRRHESFFALFEVSMTGDMQDRDGQTVSSRILVTADHRLMLSWTSGACLCVIGKVVMVCS
jgi:hypothetical protein